jgi:PIN domain nuclease of toxin-antitoxin system
MRILLDTHIFLWAITDDPRLPRHARTQYASSANNLFLSVASLWEIVLKVQLGKLVLPSPLPEYLLSQLAENEIRLLDIRAAHVFGLLDIPPLHRDPFDRLLLAQSRAEKMPILTTDEQLRQYEADFA